MTDGGQMRWCDAWGYEKLAQAEHSNLPQLGEVCTHGSLRRQCELCEMRADYDALLAAARAYVAEQEGLPPCASCGFWNGRHGDGCKLRALAELVGEERRE